MPAVKPVSEEASVGLLGMLQLDTAIKTDFHRKRRILKMKMSKTNRVRSLLSQIRCLTHCKYLHHIKVTRVCFWSGD